MLFQFRQCLLSSESILQARINPGCRVARGMNFVLRCLMFVGHPSGAWNFQVATGFLENLLILMLEGDLTLWAHTGCDKWHNRENRPRER
jgi:hypothetical protein